MLNLFHSYYFAEQQQGIGLVEVLVALILFSSVAVGYAALQARAFSTMDQSLMRQQGLMILNEISERMRVNSQLQDIDFYQTQFNAPEIPATIDCFQSNGCDAQQVAKNDVASLRHQAKSLGLRLAMVDCKTSNKGLTSKCLIAAWHDTTAGYENQGNTTSNTDVSVNAKDSSKQRSKSKACLALNGSYVKDANCVLIESY